MQQRLVDAFEMLDQGRAVSLCAGSNEWVFEVIPTDLIAAVAGVNIGSAVKVILALNLIKDICDFDPGAAVDLQHVPLSAPDARRMAATRNLILSMLAEANEDEEAIIEELSLSQRALKMRG